MNTVNWATEMRSCPDVSCPICQVKQYAIGSRFLLYLSETIVLRPLCGHGYFEASRVLSDEGGPFSRRWEWKMSMPTDPVALEASWIRGNPLDS